MKSGSLLLFRCVISVALLALFWSLSSLYLPALILEVDVESPSLNLGLMAEHSESGVELALDRDPLPAHVELRIQPDGSKHPDSSSNQVLLGPVIDSKTARSVGRTDAFLREDGWELVRNKGRNMLRADGAVNTSASWSGYSAQDLELTVVRSPDQGRMRLFWGSSQPYLIDLYAPREQLTFLPLPLPMSRATYHGVLPFRTGNYALRVNSGQGQYLGARILLGGMPILEETWAAAHLRQGSTVAIAALEYWRVPYAALMQAAPTVRIVWLACHTAASRFPLLSKTRSR